jgi:preprotein translocase subunit SecY
MWLGEKITDGGIGNGISLLIMVGIIASLPQAFLFEVGRAKPLIILVEIIILLIVILASVLLVQGVRRIPIQYAKRGATAQVAAARQYLPLKVNAAGVMPIIFAQAIMFIPITFAGLSDSESLQNFITNFSDFSGFWYNLVFALLIILFTYFYTAMTVNTNQMADDLKRNGGFVPGVKPGKDTAGFLDNVMSRIVLPGSFFLAFIAILPAFAMNAGINQSFSQFFGGTSLLIMVGVVLDTLQQIESYLLNRHYDGLMKSGRLSGRSGM